jgi:hypothetical protein
MDRKEFLALVKSRNLGFTDVCRLVEEKYLPGEYVRDLVNGWFYRQSNLDLQGKGFLRCIAIGEGWIDG